MIWNHRKILGTQIWFIVDEKGDFIAIVPTKKIAVEICNEHNLHTASSNTDG